MEDIYSDKILDNEQILTTLSEVFSELTVFHYDFNNDPPDKLDFEDPDHIFFNTERNLGIKEFDFKICLYRTPDVHHQERELYLGRIFSDKFKIRTFVTFIKSDEPDYPYYDIVFENGKTYLADDSEVDNPDGKEIIKILQEYDLPVIDFDRKARLINN